MKICYVVETYLEGLGYIDNILPFELAKKGDEVHLITCRLPAYYQKKENHFGVIEDKPAVSVQLADHGVVIHTCSYKVVGGRVLMNGLGSKLRSINPDVVVVRGLASPVLAQVVFAKLFGKFLLFTSTGQAYSAMPAVLHQGPKLSWPRFTHFMTRFFPGWVFNFFTDSCVGSTLDCVQCAVDFYGIDNNKAIVISLGVDVEIFHPVSDENSRQERALIRAEFGIPEGSLLCIWTGRMTPNKGILLLAQAIEELNKEGHAVFGLFVGAGPEAEKLTAYSHSVHHDFVPWNKLARFYRAADVGVWPRSITTSTLDASACGLPVIMSNEEQATERWQGIGSSYKGGNIESLKKELFAYIDPRVRDEHGIAGAERMQRLYSWPAVAEQFRELFSKYMRT